MVDSFLIQSYYSKISKKEGVRKSKVADSEQDVEWIPILYIQKPCTYMGIMSNGWCVETANGLRVLDHMKSYMYCIAIVETPYHEVVTSLEQVFGRDVDICDLFPFLTIIEHICNYFLSDYWVSLAISWLNEMEMEKRQRLSSCLEHIAMSKTLSQQIRHRVKRMIREVEQSG